MTAAQVRGALTIEPRAVERIASAAATEVHRRGHRPEEGAVVIRRPRRTVPAVLVAAVLLAVAVLVIWSSVQVLLGQQPVVPFADVAAAPAALTPAEPLVLAAAALCALVGLVLVVVAVVPGAPTVLPLATPAEPASRLTAGVTRRSLIRTLSRAAAVDGVDAAKVRLARRRVVVTARTPYRTAQPDLTDQVRAAVTARLADIGLARPVTVAVRLEQPRRTRQDRAAPTSTTVVGST